jgi:creatinine amidohydrolase
MEPKINLPQPIAVVEKDWNMAFLFPGEVVEARQRTGLVILPIAPIEWHGPHLTMGCDPLLAHAFARRLAAELSTPYYPPVFLGTERARTPQTLQALGFEADAYIEGMDFPANSIPSAYVREEVFALVVRDLLNILLWRMGFRHVLIVNGHGADNQRQTLDRLCGEFNASTVLTPAYERVRWVYPGFPRSLIAGSIGHASYEETSMLAASWSGCVDLGRLPASGPLKNTAFAIVDGETFDGRPTPEHTLREEQDPRFHTDPAFGERQIRQALSEVIQDVRSWNRGKYQQPG